MGISKSALLLSFAVCLAYGDDHVAGVDYFGYKGIDLEAVRAAIPIRVGDALSDDHDPTPAIQAAVKRVTGSEPTNVNFVCCDAKGNTFVFIGLRGSTSHNIEFRKTPTGTARNSKELETILKDFGDLLLAAIKSGDGALEDDSQGYALQKYGPLRALQLKLRDYALGHESELLDVLTTSRDANQRAMAAQALGYAKASRRQILALVDATDDADGTVRNNATRALVVLNNSGIPEAKLIPAEHFVPLLSSGTWTDRNKASGLLLSATASRPKELLDKIKTQELDALIEIARWSSENHAMGARMILARIAGIRDEEIGEITAGPLDVILNQIH